MLRASAQDGIGVRTATYHPHIMQASSYQDFMAFMQTSSYQDFIVQLGRNARSIRQSLGFLQEDVAELLGMTRVAIGYIEQGRRSPKLSTLYEMANLYEVDIRTFFDFEESMDQPGEEMHIAS